MLSLPQAFLDEMVAHALEDAPNECCGIIAGENERGVKLFRARNAEANKWRYTVDPDDLIKIFLECQRHGWDFPFVIYHSHTASEAYPSPTDVMISERTYPDAYYVLVSIKDMKNPVVRAFRILDGAISEEEIAAG